MVSLAFQASDWQASTVWKTALQIANMQNVKFSIRSAC